MNRMQEISFNIALIREMRVIAFINGLIDEGRIDGGKRVLVHSIEAEDVIREFSWSSRLNGDWKFMTHLYKMGRARADEWLAEKFDRIGVESTIDLREKYF
jgi:NTE family protein